MKRVLPSLPKLCQKAAEKAETLLGNYTEKVAAESATTIAFGIRIV